MRQSVWNRKEQLPKTDNAIRDVDIAPELAEVIREYTAGKSGLLFTTNDGKPLMFRKVANRRQPFPQIIWMGSLYHLR